MKLSSWALAALVVGLGCGSVKNDTHSDDDNETEGSKDKDDPSAPAADFTAQRSFPAAQIPANAFSDAAQQWALLAGKSTLQDGLLWQQLGPAPLDLTGGQLPNATPGSGRATAIAIHPTNPSTMYLGTAMGGVWKSTDAGGSWVPLTDSLSALAIGALAIDPKAPDTLYVGTGEGNLSGDSYFGRGVLKTIDAGKTWAVVGADTFAGASISKLAIDASGALYASTLRGQGGAGGQCRPKDALTGGLFKSADGGATWTTLTSGAEIGDFDIDPAASPPQILVSLVSSGLAGVGAATPGISLFKEADKSLTSVPMPEGLKVPPNIPGRLQIARAKTDPKVVYAGGSTGVFRSADGGASWKVISSAPQYCTTQCWYSNSVVVDPTDADTVYLGGSLCAVQKMTKASSDAPQFSGITEPNQDCHDPRAEVGGGFALWETGFVHPDVHAIVFHPTDPRTFYVASDGGLAMTDDGGLHWARKNDGLATNQFYRLCVDPNDSSVLLGGLQDNGTAEVAPFPGSTLWNQVGGGDGTGCLVNLKDPRRDQRYTLTSSQNGNMSFFDGDGNETDVAAAPKDPQGFVTLLVQDPAHALTVYTGTNRVFRSSDGGKSGWTAISPVLAGRSVPTNTTCDGRPEIVSALAIAPGSQRLYAGTRFGNVFTSPDGGATWTEITRAPLPQRWITQVAIHPTDPNIVYVAMSGFAKTTPQARGHIFRSLDAGTTWARVDGPLEPLDVPVNALRVHPQNSNILYAGTDLGVLVTIDGGNTWNVLGTGLPNVAAYDILFHQKDSKLLVATHGRSAWAMRFEPVIAADQTAITLTATAGGTAAAPLQVSNSETAGSMLEYAISSDDAPWLSFAPANGLASGLIANQHTVTASTQNLAKGQHTGTVVVQSLRALKPELRIPVSLTVN